MLDYKEIGARIKWKRKEKGITQESLAERVDISTVYLSKIENGHVHPALDLLDAICGALDSKRRKKLMQKRLAMGHKQDDHEQAQGYEQSL